MSCEKTEKNNKERYARDLKKAILLKFKAVTSPSPDIMVEAEKETMKLYQNMSDYSGKTVKTIIKEVDEKFSEEWGKETENEFKKESMHMYRQRKYREVKTMLYYMAKKNGERG